ncbi:MAG: enoyl-CoA hydratase/isomerase family protein [Sphingomonadaceae bacterium]
MADELLFERSGAVARLTLNRPMAGNALDLPLARALMDAAISCDEDDSIRCVLLTGNGRLFCAGGDVGSFSNAGERLPNFLKEITACLHSAIARFVRMEKPLVTAINGPAAGAGIGLALMGDIALADPAAHFTLAYTALGIAPDGGTTWLLPRLVGMRRAQELVLCNRRVGAQEAAEIGLITRVTAEGQMLSEAEAQAQQLAQAATGALGATRRLLLDSFTTTLETQMELESRAITARARSAEGREGIAAFLEKRPPQFNREPS